MKWPFGGPVRLRVPRQLGYKNIKYITRLTLTDNVRFGKGLGSGVGGRGDRIWIRVVRRHLTYTYRSEL
jgi:DMSO/TMAO reductase YedYZ molybdopterin-dependent catalytic subunit